MPDQPSMRRILSCGVREYWIVDPTDVLTTPLLPGLEISLADLFRTL